MKNNLFSKDQQNSYIFDLNKTITEEFILIKQEISNLKNINLDAFIG